ncbi:MAG: metallophosphoesterase [Treponema sp.]|nr:metallophosphoesterase [Treponema sp.]
MRLAIGDIHGKPFWKDYLDEDFTEFYLLGDYFDSYGLSFSQEYVNFERIIEAARFDSRLKLCLGNHDYHYLKEIPDNDRYSRFQSRHHAAIQEILEESMDLLSVVYLTPDNFLISHAGISRTFSRLLGLDGVEGCNRVFTRDRSLFSFNGLDSFGNDVTQGPFWIRPAALEADALPGYTHIVGHTPHKCITSNIADDMKTRCVYIDTGNSKSVYRF